ELVLFCIDCASSKFEAETGATTAVSRRAKLVFNRFIIVVSYFKQSRSRLKPISEVFINPKKSLLINIIINN
ncbi:MAG TPA: hypothetical protein DCS35_00085, partial [Vibrio sp.]|nr:hypothetical protein [Vibrio sp.]